MIDWEHIFLKNEFTENELKTIPNLRCESMFIIARYFKEIKNVNDENLYKGFSDPKIITDSKNWISIYDFMVFTRNLIENSSSIITHRDFFEAGKYFRYSLNSLYIIFFKLLSCMQVIKETRRNVKKFTNSYEMDCVGLKNGFAYIIIKKLPFFKNLSLGHECRFSEGTYAANFELHNVKDYSINHIICEESIESIIKKYYSEYSVKYEEREDGIFLNNTLIGKKVCLRELKIEGRSLFTDLTDEKSLSYNAIKIIKNFKIGDRIIFELDEIYNAPHCCLKLEWKEPSFFKRLKNIIKTKSLLIKALVEIEEQIEFSDFKIYQMYRILGEVEELNSSLEQKISDSTIELEKKNTELKNFLGKVSHELRTPLNAILGYSKLSIENETNDEKLRKLNIIFEASEKLLKFANEIVTFSKLESKNSELNYQKIAISKVLNDVKEFKIFELKRKNLFFNYEIEPGMPEEIVTDELKLFQIISNIVENAIKFTENGGIYINCSYTEDKILIEIADTGVGIPEAQTSAIFNLFERLDSKKDGFGLGLAIVKMIVESMDGEIWVESRLKTGTNFFIKIPDKREKFLKLNFVNDWINRTNRSDNEKDIFFMAINELPFLFGQLRKSVYIENYDSTAKAIRTIEEISANFFINDINEIIIDLNNKMVKDKIDYPLIKETLEILEKTVMSINYERIPYLKFISNESNADFKVLIVDDHKINRNLFKEFLSQIGVKSELAENGAIALEKLEIDNYNVVLLDIEMPVLNGEETLKAIRKNSKFSNIRIIALTASATIGSKEKYLKMGFDDYLSKPIQKEILFRILNLEQKVSN